MLNRKKILIKTQTFDELLNQFYQKRVSEKKIKVKQMQSVMQTFGKESEGESFPETLVRKVFKFEIRNAKNYFHCFCLRFMLLAHAKCLDKPKNNYLTQKRVVNSAIALLHLG